MPKLGTVIIVATLTLAAVVLYLAAQHPYTPAQGETTVAGVSCSSYSTSFTIVASQSGYNDSIAHGAPNKPWPIICAEGGEEITIAVVNSDTAEPHGFAIAGYQDAGVTVLPGHTVVLQFFAGTPGDFKIYCNVICAVHAFMQSGVLVVS